MDIRLAQEPAEIHRVSECLARQGMTKRYELTSAQWVRIENLPPDKAAWEGAFGLSLVMDHIPDGALAAVSELRGFPRTQCPSSPPMADQQPRPSLWLSPAPALVRIPAKLGESSGFPAQGQLQSVGCSGVLAIEDLRNKVGDPVRVLGRKAHCDEHGCELLRRARSIGDIPSSGGRDARDGLAPRQKLRPRNLVDPAHMQVVQQGGLRHVSHVFEIDPGFRAP